jgi:hypothetical protein
MARKAVKVYDVPEGTFSRIVLRLRDESRFTEMEEISRATETSHRKIGGYFEGHTVVITKWPGDSSAEKATNGGLLEVAMGGEHPYTAFVTLERSLNEIGVDLEQYILRKPTTQTKEGEWSPEVQEALERAQARLYFRPGLS